MIGKSTRSLALLRSESLLLFILLLISWTDSFLVQSIPCEINQHIQLVCKLVCIRRKIQKVFNNSCNVHADTTIYWTGITQQVQNRVSNSVRAVGCLSLYCARHACMTFFFYKFLLLQEPSDVDHQFLIQWLTLIFYHHEYDGVMPQLKALKLNFLSVHLYFHQCNDSLSNSHPSTLKNNPEYLHQLHGVHCDQQPMSLIFY